MFETVYQTGGRNGKWRRALPVATREESVRQVMECERMGFPAYTGEVYFWDAIGLPNGPAPHWDYTNLRRKYVAESEK
jgi:hypothetical protein